jgi:hypothetical protein
MKSATDLMTEIVTAAMLDGFAALKAASGGLPNAMARDLQAIHPNTAVADLPPEVQKAIGEATRAAFARLLKEGFAVAPGVQPRPPAPAGPGGPRPGGGHRPGGAGPRRGPAAPPVVETRRRPPGGPRPGGPGGSPGPRGPRRPPEGG